MRKLNYLTMIRSDIIFTVSIVSQFLLALRTTYLEIVMRILRYLEKKTLGRGTLYSDQGHPCSRFLQCSLGRWLFDMRLTTEYYVFLEGNLVIEKQEGE